MSDEQPNWFEKWLYGVDPVVKNRVNALPKNKPLDTSMLEGKNLEMTGRTPLGLPKTLMPANTTAEDITHRAVQNLNSGMGKSTQMMSPKTVVSDTGINRLNPNSEMDVPPALRPKSDAKGIPFWQHILYGLAFGAKPYLSHLAAGELAGAKPKDDWMTKADYAEQLRQKREKSPQQQISQIDLGIYNKILKGEDLSPEENAYLEQRKPKTDSWEELWKKNNLPIK